MNRIYYRRTTASQRIYLFEKWKELDNVTDACKLAKVVTGTFYYWKNRFEKEGYSGLKKTKSNAPLIHFCISKEIAEAIVELRKSNPLYGKVRIANELSKNNQWQSVVSPSSVLRILHKEGLISPKQKKKA